MMNPFKGMTKEELLGEAQRYKHLFECSQKIDKSKNEKIRSLEAQLAALNQAAEAMPLRVVRAAILDEFDGVHSLPIPSRHHDVIAKMREAGYLGSVREQGFLLSDGRFCRRKPAERVARQSGQLKGDMISSVLTSEDLW